MDVLDHQQHRPVPRREREQGDDRLEEAQLRLARVGRRLRQPIAGERREELAELSQRRAEGLLEAVEILLVEVVADRLDEREIGQRHLRIARSTGEHRAAELSGLTRELSRQPGLPDPGLAGQHDEAALAAARRQQGVLEDAELVVTPDQDRAESGSRHPLILP